MSPKTLVKSNPNYVFASYWSKSRHRRHMAKTPKLVVNSWEHLAQVILKNIGWLHNGHVALCPFLY